MKIMMTGSSGFIGSHILNNFKNGYDILPLKIRENVDIEKLSSEILDFNPDIFIHCGWWGGDSNNKTHDYRQFNNVILGKKLFQVFNKLENLYFVGFGSFSEYGDVDVPIHENFDERPVSLYGASKNIFKHFSQYACEVNNFNWLWVRPCYVYGPNDLNTRFIPKVIRACMSNDDEIVFDSCDSVVDYLYIDDFVDALSLLIESKCGGVFNVCSGKQYKVKRVIEKIKSICNSNIDFVFDSEKDRNKFSKYVCGVNDKLMSQNRWKPRYDLDSGLRRTIKLI